MRGEGGGRGGQTVSLYRAYWCLWPYYAPNKFLSLLFSPGTLNGQVENVVELLLQTVICDRDQL